MPTRFSLLAALCTGVALTASSALGFVPSKPVTLANGKITLDFNAQLRVESRENTFDFNSSTDTVNDDTFTLTRVRLGAKVKLSDKVSLYAQLQDSREFDSKRPEVPYVNAAEGNDPADIRQFYFDLGDAKTDPVSARIGRQMLAYGDERLIGGFEWNNLARTFDAAKLVFNAPKIKTSIDAFLSSVVTIKGRNLGQAHDFDLNTSNPKDLFAGVYLQNSGALPNAKSDVYLLYRGKTENGPFYRPNTLTTGTSGVAPYDIPEKIFTLGFRTQSIESSKLKGFDYGFEAALQWGKARPGLNNSLVSVPDWYDHSAYAMHAEVGYNFTTLASAPRLSLEYNVASGDSDSTDTRSEAFLNLFHTNHKFFGFMDTLGWKNMRSVSVSARLKPFAALNNSLKKSVLRLDYHWLALKTTQDLWYRANAISPVATPSISLRSNLPSELGQELDATWSWAPSASYAFVLGYSYFNSGDYLPAARASGSTLGRADNARFLYLQTVVKF